MQSALAGCFTCGSCAPWPADLACLPCLFTSSRHQMPHLLPLLCRRPLDWSMTLLKLSAAWCSP